MRPDGPRDLVAGPDSGPQPPLPLKLSGKVITGFGRGSSELGIPTANIPISGLSVGGHEDVESGVYYGWAGLSSSKATTEHPPGSANDKYKLMQAGIRDDLSKTTRATSHDPPDGADPQTESERSTGAGQGAVYPMVMSIGWNLFYKNERRSVEVHIMQHFDTDFYDAHMNLVILGFIRPEYDYVSRDSLIEDIRTDIDVAGRSLTREAYARWKGDPYLLQFAGREDVAS